MRTADITQEEKKLRRQAFQGDEGRTVFEWAVKLFKQGKSEDEVRYEVERGSSFLPDDTMSLLINAKYRASK